MKSASLLARLFRHDSAPRSVGCHGYLARAPRSATTTKPRLERLVDRLALSGFGPDDGSYIVEPWSGSYEDVQVQPADQKIVGTGTKYTYNNNVLGWGMALARYDSQANADAAFGSGGLAAPTLGPSSESGQSLVVQPNGKFVVSGSNDANTSLAVAQFNANGTLDSTFGNAGWNSLDVRSDSYESARGLGLQSSGKIVVSGYSVASFGAPANNLSITARFTASGAVDNGRTGYGQPSGRNTTGYTTANFGSTLNAFKELAVQTDDKVVTVGSLWGAAGYRLIVARYTAGGTLDTTFVGSGYSVLLPAGMSNTQGSDVAIQPDGKIVVAGSCTGVDGAYDFFVARYNVNGTLDASFGGGTGYVSLDVDGAATVTNESGGALELQPDGKIVVAGSERSTTAGSTNVILVARFNADGTPDTTFGPAGYKVGVPLSDTGYHDFVARGVALQSNGSIIVSGDDYWGPSAAPNTSLAHHPLLMRFSGAANAPAAAPSTAAATDAALLLLMTDDPLTTTKRK